MMHYFDRLCWLQCNKNPEKKGKSGEAKTLQNWEANVVVLTEDDRSINLVNQILILFSVLFYYCRTIIIFINAQVN